LWETGPIIQAANNALAAFLGENNLAQPYQVEFIMEKLFKEQPTIYNPNGDSKYASSPVMLTQLRKDAVQKLLIESNRFSEDEANIFADSAFQVWSEARHRSISQNLVPNAIECLDNIQSLRAASDKPVVIGAITDGNSSPFLVPSLAKYFDFVVDAETAGVSKPDRRLYLSAIKEAVMHPNLQDIFKEVDKENDDKIEEIIGRWWVHIGANFLNDVLAAKDMRIRTIWSPELVCKKEYEIVEENTSISIEDFEQEIAGKSVVRMTVGSDAYVADSLESEFADATLYSIKLVAEKIARWHLEAMVKDKKIFNEQSNIVQEQK